MEHLHRDRELIGHLLQVVRVPIERKEGSQVTARPMGYANWLLSLSMLEESCFKFNEPPL